MLLSKCCARVIRESRLGIQGKARGVAEHPVVPKPGPTAENGVAVAVSPAGTEKLCPHKFPSLPLMFLSYVTMVSFQNYEINSSSML